MPRNRVQHQKGLPTMPSKSFTRMRRPAGKPGSLGDGLRASSARDAEQQSIARSATVDCCNAEAAATKHR